VIQLGCSLSVVLRTSHPINDIDLCWINTWMGDHRQMR